MTILRPLNIKFKIVLVLPKFLGTILLVILLFSLNVRGQNGVGIGINPPHSSAILHVHSSNGDKGLLIPESTTSMIGSLSTAYNGLLIYDMLEHRFAYRKNTEWMYLNPWDTETLPLSEIGTVSYINSSYNVGIGVSGAPTSSLEVVGEVTATKYEGLGILPIGGIIMWSGFTDEIPDGFELCDGTPPTPNLVDRFVLGSNLEGIGGMGGVNTMTSTLVNYEEITEEITDDDCIPCSPYPYLYTGTFTATSSFDQDGCSRGQVFTFANAPGGSCTSAGAPEGCPVGQGTCTSTIANSAYYLDNPDCINENFRSIELTNSTENRPAYYQLAFIMRIE